MPHPARYTPRPLLLAMLLALHPLAGIADDATGEIIIEGGLEPAAPGGEIVIDAGPMADGDTLTIEGGSSDVGAEIVIDGGNAAAPADEITIDGGPGAADGEALTIDAGDGPGEAIIIDDTAPAEGIVIEAPAQQAGTSPQAPDALPLADAESSAGRFTIGFDSARAEYGHFTDGGAASANSLYGNLAASANWQPNAQWEFQLAGRVDGYSEDDRDSFTTVRGDYGDSFVRYRAETTTLTLGSQTAIWGRMDEIPLSDRVSTVDLTRGILDDLDERRRSTPMLRAESFVAGGKLDLAWLYDFRGAELPDQDSVWYPVNRREGRLPGISPNDVNPALIRGARIIDDAPDGDGGFGARYTRTHSFADIGVTVAKTRQSIPYYRAAGAGVLQAEYPRSWAFGADTAINASDAVWRAEVVYTSDNPVTRTDISYTTTPGIQWGAGVEFFPGDGDNRVSLQLIGNNLIDAPAVFDRTEQYSFNGEVALPFDRERWRLDVDFIVGVGHDETYLNPELTFLGWEPHEVYLGVHYFDGDDQSLGGFYQDNSIITLGWRASF